MRTTTDTYLADVNAGTAGQIIAAVHTVLNRQEQESFDPGQYPLHYAERFVLEHPEVLGLDPDFFPSSVSAAATAITEYAAGSAQNRGRVCTVLADAYLLDHALVETPHGRAVYRSDLNQRLVAVAAHREAAIAVACEQHPDLMGGWQPAA